MQHRDDVHRDDVHRDDVHRDDVQTRFSTAQVMTVPLVAASLLHSWVATMLWNALARRFLHCHGYFSSTLSASRFNRRLHAISPNLRRTLFEAHLV